MMAFIKWNESLSVKINSIDEQHKKLIALINDFYENVNNRSNHESISALIYGMKKYTIKHFSIEEKLMRQFNYPAFVSHQKEHDGFINRVNDLEKKFNSGSLVLSFEITSFLKDWINEHIMSTDMQYSEFFLEKGLQ